MRRVVLLLLPALIVIGNSMYLPLLPALQESFAMTQQQGAWLLSIFTLAGIGAIPAGLFLAERTSFQVAMRVGCGFVIVGALGGLVVPQIIAGYDYLFFIVSRTLQGLGAGSLTALTYTYVGSVMVPAARLNMFGLLERSNGLAKMLSPLLGGLLLSVSWRYGSLLLLGIALFCFVILERGIDERSCVDEQESSRKGRLWPQIGMVLASYTMSVAHLFVLYGLLYDAAYTFFTLGVSPLWRGIMLALPFLAMVIIATQVERLGKYRYIQQAPMFLLVFGAILLYAKGNSVVFLLALLVIGASSGLALPLASQMLAQLSPVTLKERMLSGLSMARFAGIASAPIVYERWMASATSLAHRTLLLSLLAWLLVFAIVWQRRPQLLQER